MDWKSRVWFQAHHHCVLYPHILLPNWNWGLFPWGVGSGLSIKLTSNFHPVPRLRMHGTLPPLSHTSFHVMLKQIYKQLLLFHLVHFQNEHNDLALLRTHANKSFIIGSPRITGAKALSMMVIIQFEIPPSQISPQPFQTHRQREKKEYF
jgi:hypothetical protein